MLLHYGSLSLNFKAHMAVHPFCYPTPHTISHTPLYLGPEQTLHLPVSSATAPTAAGTAPRAGLRGSWSVLVQNYPPSPGAVGRAWADAAASAPEVSDGDSPGKG